ncbi:hypothetical protein CK203_109150 [Vitis vinifera]|uniref:Uncharacterized protein n=1 Tax=Vitis vinifera TaxID=29760 RepID=A0A438C737_VITVI|nr:hypothetical protein CK203_109150 [Vitis vinifera]
MEGVYNDLSLRIEKVQDSIEKLTNLDIARGKRKLPPQPHHNLQGTNAKKSRKFKMIKGYLNPLKHPLLQGREEKRIPLDQMGRIANFVWDPGGIQHEVGTMLAKIEMEVKQRNRGAKMHKQSSQWNFAP